MLKVKWLVVKQIERQSRTKNGSHHGENIKMSSGRKEKKNENSFLLFFNLDGKDDKKKRKRRMKLLRFIVRGGKFSRQILLPSQNVQFCTASWGLLTITMKISSSYSTSLYTRVSCFFLPFLATFNGFKLYFAFSFQFSSL